MLTYLLGLIFCTEEAQGCFSSTKKPLSIQEMPNYPYFHQAPTPAPFVADDFDSLSGRMFGSATKIIVPAILIISAMFLIYKKYHSSFYNHDLPNDQTTEPLGEAKDSIEESCVAKY